MEATKKLYVMISRTDTGVGNIIRFFSNYEYNHVSLSLDGSFRTWVSFARYVRDTPLYGGFIREPVERFLAGRKRIDVRIFALDIPESRYLRLAELFSLAGRQDFTLLYNHLSLIPAIVGMDLPIPGAYTCLGFANRVMGTQYASIRDLNSQLQPELIYEGDLADLVQDSGCRDDVFFTKLGPLQGTACTMISFAKLMQFAVFQQNTDPVISALAPRP